MDSIKFKAKLSLLEMVKVITYTRVSEPEPGTSYKNRRLRNPETPSRYIIARDNERIYFLITLGTLLKSLLTNLLYFELWEPQSHEPAQNRWLRNPKYTYILKYFFLPLHE